MDERKKEIEVALCKKIADMTKTVFKLHSESNATKEYLDELKEFYNDEFNEIKIKSKEITDDVKNKIDLIKRGNNILNKSEENYDQNFKYIKEKLEDQVNSITNQAKRDIQFLKTQMNELRHKMEDQRKLFQKAQQEINVTTTSVVSTIKDNHQKEYSKHLIEANKQFNDLVIQSVKREEDLRKRYELEITNLRNSAAEGQRSASEALTLQESSINNRYNELLLDKESILQNIKLFNEQIEIHQNKTEHLLQEAQYKKNIIEASHSESINNLKVKIENCKNNKEAEIRKIKEEAKRDKAKFEVKSMQLKNQIEFEKELRTKGNNISEQYKKEMNEIDDKHQIFLDNIKSINEKLENEFSKIENENNYKIEQIEEFINDEEKRHKEKIKEIKENHRKTMKEIQQNQKEELENICLELNFGPNDKIQNLLNEIQQIRNDIEILKDKNNFEYRMKQKKLKNDKEKEKYERTIKEIKNNHQKNIENLQNEIKKKIHSLKMEHKQQMKQLDEMQQKELENEKNKLLIELEKQRKEKLDIIRNEYENKLKIINLKIIETQKLINEIENSQKEKLQNKNQIENLNIKINESEKLYKNEIDQKKNELKGKILKLKSEHMKTEKKNEELKRNKENEFSYLYKIFSKQLKKDENEKKNLINELTKSIDEVKERNFNQQQNLGIYNNKKDEEDLNTQKQFPEIKNQIEQINQNTEKRLKIIEDEQTTETDKLQSIYDNLIKFGEDHIKQLDEFYQSIKTINANIEKVDLKDKNKVLKEKLTTLQKEVEDFWKTLIDEFQVSAIELSNKTELQKKNNDDIISLLKGEYDQRIETMKKRFEDEKNSINKEIQEIEMKKKQTISQLESDIKQWEEKFRCREARTEDLERIKKLEEMIKEKSNEIQNMERKQRRGSMASLPPLDGVVKEKDSVD